jgi:NitT/TauT family transport system permease protein
MTMPDALDLPRAERQESLTRRLGRHARAVVPVLAGAAIFLAAWQLVVVIGGYKPFILPGPGTVAARLVTAWADGTMTPHAVATLEEILLGFLAGALAGTAVGYLLARSRLANLMLSPYLVAAQSTPILALAPLFALWFGSGLLTVVVICALIVFFPVAVSTLVGLRSVDRRLLELGRSLRATRRQVLLTLEIPAALPSVMGGLRVGVTLSVVGAIIGEWAGGGQDQRGLGSLINLARASMFDIPLMYATLFTIALIGVGLYALTVLLERRLVGPRA